MNARQKAELIKACEKRIARVQHQLDAPIKTRKQISDCQNYLAQQIANREKLLAIQVEDDLPPSIPPYCAGMFLSLR
jgi:Flp pilus assembly protein CpaB